MRGFCLLAVCLLHVLGVAAFLAAGERTKSRPVTHLMQASILAPAVGHPTPAQETRPLPVKQRKKPKQATTVASHEIAEAHSSNTVAADEVQTEEDATPEPQAGTVDKPTMPAYRFNPAPAYPPLSRRLQEEGLVLLKVHVTPDGRAFEVRIEKSSGKERLDRAALSAVQNWQFEPALIQGQSVSTWVLVPVNFRLRGS